MRLARHIPTVGLTLTLSIALMRAAFASDAASIVVPGRPDVPVFINGIDATGAVVLRDWGLSRPGVPVEIEPGPYLITPSRLPAGYYPATGRRPRYGRKEFDPGPNRRLPPPAESYHRSWSSEPAPEYARQTPADYAQPGLAGGEVAPPAYPEQRPPITQQTRRSRHATRGPQSMRRGRSHAVQ